MTLSTMDIRRWTPVVAALVALLCAAAAQAAPSVVLSVDRSRMAVGDTVALTVRVAGDGATGRPVIRGLQDFHVSGPATSSQYQVINGKARSWTDYIYEISPTRTGEVTIGPAMVDAGQDTQRSNTVNIEVTEARENARDNDKSVFFTAKVNRDKGWPGQELVYTLTLYANADVRNPRLELPDVQGVTLKQLGEPRNFQTTITGTRYRALEIDFSMFVADPGPVALPPARMHMQIVVPQNSAQRRRTPFGGDLFGFTRTVQHTEESDAVAVEIVPFPEQGRPPDFGGLVGDFAITSELNPAKVKAGESATFTVTLSGTGNVRLFPDLEFPEIPGVKSYADQPVFEEQATQRGTRGTKTMKWALVPREQGEITIPPMGVSCFDPEREAYRTLRTDPMVLRVLPGAAPDVTGGRVSAPEQPEGKKEVAVLGRDIFPVHESPDALKAPGFQTMDNGTRAMLLALPLLPLFLGLGVLLVGRWRASGNGVAVRKRALSGFRKTSEGLDADDCVGLHKAFCAFVRQRLGHSGASLSPAEVRSALTEAGADGELAEEAELLCANLEACVFAGVGAGDAGRLRDGALDLAKRIDKAVR
ncbi:MAG: BatD family protein [Desulfatibacillaceae bacterium]